jgi:hypothetical protein
LNLRPPGPQPGCTRDRQPSDGRAATPHYVVHGNSSRMTPAVTTRIGTTARVGSRDNGAAALTWRRRSTHARALHCVPSRRAVQAVTS